MLDLDDWSKWKEQAALLPYGASSKVLHCGSSPAARLYNSANGVSYYCFRCGERDFAPHGPRSAADILAARQASGRLIESRSIPDRAIHLTDPKVPSQALLWILKAGLTPETASEVHGMRFDPETKRVLIPLTDGFLARAVYGEKPKYLKAGPAEYYKLGMWDDILVVVEDCLSAIKVNAAGFNAMALLGTSMTATTVALIGSYRIVVNWTDNDKAGTAAYIKLRKALGLYETSLRRIVTDEDPKYIHKEKIKQLIGYEHDA